MVACANSKSPKNRNVLKELTESKCATECRWGNERKHATHRACWSHDAALLGEDAGPRHLVQELILSQLVRQPLGAAATLQACAVVSTGGRGDVGDIEDVRDEAPRPQEPAGLGRAASALAAAAMRR